MWDQCEWKEITWWKKGRWWWDWEAIREKVQARWDGIGDCSADQVSLLMLVCLYFTLSLSLSLSFGILGEKEEFHWKPRNLQNRDQPQPEDPHQAGRQASSCAFSCAISSFLFSANSSTTPLSHRFTWYDKYQRPRLPYKYVYFVGPVGSVACISAPLRVCTTSEGRMAIDDWVRGKLNTGEQDKLVVHTRQWMACARQRWWKSSKKLFSSCLHYSYINVACRECSLLPLCSSTTFPVVMYTFSSKPGLCI